MFTLRKQFKFEASHQLHQHDGKCARLHGHSWSGWVEVQTPGVQGIGPELGMAMDYGRISEVLDPLVDQYLDHYHLNDSLGIYPTSEMIAHWIYEQLKPRLLFLTAVVIEETCTSYCEYRP